MKSQFQQGENCLTETGKVFAFDDSLLMQRFIQSVNRSHGDVLVWSNTINVYAICIINDSN